MFQFPALERGLVERNIVTLIHLVIIYNVNER
jgi:hypothetical protein